MSRSSSERVSEEEVLQQQLLDKLEAIWVDGEYGKWERVLEICNWYADQKIKQMMFDEQAIKGLIRVKTENGTLWLTPEKFEEYKKTLEGALLREVK